MTPTDFAPTQFTYAFAKEKGLVVLPGRDQMTVAVRQGADPLALVEARRALGSVFALESLDKDSYDRLLAEAFASGPMADDDVDAAVESRGGLESLIDDIPKAADLLDGQDDAPVIRLINGLIHEAIKRRASDIHIDPFENHLSIRYRIDGDLVEVLTPPRKLAAPILSRIKVMARLDIAEKRLPQDGRIRPAGHQPDADGPQGRPDLRGDAPLHSSSGSECCHGRRDSRFRNGGSRV